MLNPRSIVWAGLSIWLVAQPTLSFARECPSPLGRYDRGWSEAVAAYGDGFVFGNGSALVVHHADGSTTEIEIGAMVVALDVVDDYAYVVGDGGLRIVDLLAPDGPSVAGRCPLPGVPVSVEVLDDLAYISGGEWGMCVVNVLDPAEPIELDGVEAPFWTSDTAVDTVDGAPVVISGEPVIGRLSIIDALDPEALEVVAEVGTSGSFSVEAIDGLAYAIDWAGVDLSAVDLSTPDGPEIVGYLELDHTEEPAALAVEGGFAYVVGKHFYVIDISDPALMYQVSEIEEFRGGEDVAVADGHVAVAAGDTVRFIDATNPQEPVEGESWQVGDFPRQAGGISAIGGYVIGYSKGSWGPDPTPGIRIFDASNPRRPVQVGGCLEESFIGDVEVVGDLVYVVTQDSVFHIVDMTDVFEPREIGSLQLASNWIGDGSLVDLDVDGDLAVVIGSVGMIVVDIRDPAQPSWMGELVTPFSHVELDGRRAFVADGDKIRLVDLTLSWNPRVVDDELYRIQLGGEVRDFEIADGHAFVFVGGDSHGFFSVVDVGTETGWTVVGTESGSGRGWRYLDGGLSLMGSQAVVAVEDGWLEISHRGRLIVFDISNPADPREIANTVMPGEEHAVLLEGNKVYVTDSRAGIAVYNAWPCRLSQRMPPEIQAPPIE